MQTVRGDEKWEGGKVNMGHSRGRSHVLSMSSVEAKVTGARFCLLTVLNPLLSCLSFSAWPDASCWDHGNTSST